MQTSPCVIQLNTKELRAYERNARTHSKRQIKQIAASIRRFGFVSPILIDSGAVVIAGHGRLAAARLLGLETVPTLCVDHLSPAEVRALRLADNKIAEAAGWDPELLSIELRELELSLGADLTVTGFSMGELDILIGDASEDNLIEPVLHEWSADEPPVTEAGDIWEIGTHRLICGDARDSKTYAELLETDRARLVFADPPYNVPVQGHVGGRGAIKRDEFAMASGEMTPAEFTAFLRNSLELVASHAELGAVVFICMDWRHLHELLSAAQDVLEPINLAVWVKPNAGMGSLYRSQHGLVLVARNGSTPHINNVELGRHGRSRSNVWRYAGATSVGKARNRALSLHPTVKPVALVADAIRDCSNRGDIVLDPFAGSGTTLAAAQQTGRRCFGIEIDPRFVDTTIGRLKQSFGLVARLRATGQAFDDVRKSRVEVP